MEEFNLAVEAAIGDNNLVSMWLNWMMAIFLLSLLFVWKHVPARYVLASFIATMPLAVLIFNATGKVHLIGLAHLLVWIPLAYYLWTKVISGPDFNKSSWYGTWILLILATITISMLFDVRDVVMTLVGMK